MNLIAEIKTWCIGKNWIWRLAFLFFLIYIGARQILNPSDGSFFNGVNLGVHELGHLLFGFTGEFMMIAGGTIIQIAAPLICAGMFLKQPDYFALSFAGIWLATNFYNIAVYVADASRLELPLVRVGGGETYHDWEYMLSKTNLLSYNDAIAFGFRIAGFICIAVSVIYGAWIIYIMADSPKQNEPSF